MNENSSASMNSKWVIEQPVANASAKDFAIDKSPIFARFWEFGDQFLWGSESLEKELKGAASLEKNLGFCDPHNFKNTMVLEHFRDEKAVNFDKLTACK